MDLIAQIGDGPEPRSSAHRAAAGALPHHRARGAPRQQRAVLFRQRRYGFNNELIELYNFRSMFVDLSDADATRLVGEGDPRVTRVGASSN